MTKSKEKPTLIIDTREKQPLQITCGKIYDNIIREKLDTGDYSIVGLEDVLCIERKGSVSEFAQNVIQDRFVRELDRMTHKYSFVLFEFTLEEMLKYPRDCGIPIRTIKKIRYNGKFVLSKLIGFQLTYPHIHFVFAGEDSVDFVNRICKQVVEKE